MTIRVVQPWGPDKAKQSTVSSEHPAAALARPLHLRRKPINPRRRAPRDAVKLIVVDADGPNDWQPFARLFTWTR